MPPPSPALPFIAQTGPTMEDSVKYLEVQTSTVEGTNGVSYAYRHLGPRGRRPLVLLQHFRGNLENWDPELIDALAASRDVIAFDNVGVGATTGTTPHSFAQMADDAIVFVEALGLDSIDVLGFSIGSFIAQEIALTRPSLVAKLILASTAPQGAPGMHGRAPDIIGAIGEPTTDAKGMLHAFFTKSPAGRDAGEQFLGRIFTRTAGRDEETTWQTRNAQYDAVVKWGTPNFGMLQRLAAIQQPVFIANGDDDRMIWPGEPGWRPTRSTADILPDDRELLHGDVEGHPVIKTFTRWARPTSTTIAPHPS